MSEDNVSQIEGEVVESVTIPAPNTEDQTTPAESEAAADQAQTPDTEDSREEQSDEPKQKPRSRFQERIDNLTQARRDAERRAEQAERKAALAYQRLQRAGLVDPNDWDATQAATVSKALAESQIEDARAEYEDAARQRETLDIETRAARKDAFVDRVQESLDRMPDFFQVFNDSLPVTDHMAELIAESPSGVEVAYYLGKNPNEAARIASLPLLKQAAELVRLEARVTPPKTRKISNAPQPPTKISGAAASAGKSITDMSISEMQAHLKQSGVL